MTTESPDPQPTPVEPTTPQLIAAELASAARWHVRAYSPYLGDAGPLLLRLADAVERQAAEIGRLKNGDHCSRCGSLLENESQDQDDDQWFCAFCRSLSELHDLRERLAAVEREWSEAQAIADFSGTMNAMANEFGRMRMHEAALERDQVEARELLSRWMVYWHGDDPLRGSPGIQTSQFLARASAAMAWDERTVESC